MWINDTTGEVMPDEAALMAAFPNTIFVRNADGTMSPPDGVREVSAPTYDPFTQRITATRVSGEWTLLTEPMSAAERKSLVPKSVTRRQARQALLLAGLLDSVPAAIAALPDPTQRGLAQIEWDDSQAFERNRPLLIQLATALGLDDGALDALFVQASKL